MSKKAVIVGYGFVGKATEKFLQQFNDIEIHIQDPMQGKEALFSNYDFVFICVPTDLDGTGRLNASIVDEVYDMFSGEKIIRSTLGPDQCHDYPEAVFWPEFLREITWEDQLSQPEVEHVIGSYSSDTFGHWLAGKIDSITLVTPAEACMFKMARNAFLALKVTFANMLYDKCERHNVNYNNVKELFKRNIDPTTHLDVPGPDGKRGYGGKCLPKDSAHYKHLSHDLLMQTMININKAIR